MHTQTVAYNDFQHSAKRSENLTFNIIFVPGTVRSLQFFTRSVIRYASCRFRLISNACSDAENALLHEIAEQSESVEFYDLGLSQPMRHGLLLDHLQRREQSGVFAFMDSDIYATGDFVPFITDEIAIAQALFSCPPVWCNEAMQVALDGGTQLKGYHNRLYNGSVIGSTYFSVYDNTVLGALIEETNVSFEAASWGDVSPQIQADLLQQNLKYQHYDTGKLVNLLLLTRKCELRTISIDNLNHVGGCSLDTLARTRHEQYHRVLPQRCIRSLRSYARSLLDHAGCDCRLFRRPVRSEKCELGYYSRIRQRRLMVSRYITSVICTTLRRQVMPGHFEHTDDELVLAVQSMRSDIEKLLQSAIPRASDGGW